jgi:transposase
MLGVDVSKAELVCALFDRPSERIAWEGTVPNTPAGIRKLLARTPAAVPLVVEPTGRYSHLVVHQAREAGRTVLLAPPRKVHAYLRSLSTRASTDRLAARGLAMFAASRPKAEGLRPFPVKSADVEALEQLLRARRGLQSALTSLEQRRRELPHAADVLAEAVADLKTRLAELDRQIAQRAQDKEQFPATKALRKIPGIGPVISAALAARLTSHDFAHADQVVAYIGLDIRVRQSGKRAGEYGLTKEGDAELRRLLYLAAKSNVRIKDSPFRQQYERELAKGLAKTAALNAVARKLAKVCWAVVKHGEEYDPERVYRQPTSPRRGEPAPPSEGSAGAEPAATNP